MTVEENKAVVRRFNEGIQQFFLNGDVSGLDEICAPDFVHHGPGMPPDLEGFKQMAPMFRAAFPDLEAVTEDLIAEGDLVVDRITVRGTHQGDFMRIPPSGQRFEMQEIHIARIVDGKIAERWTQFDLFGLLQQIGGIPAAPETAYA
jgi:predicted ester cyclase